MAWLSAQNQLLYTVFTV